MNLDSLIGQTLDSKYLIERELGRGGRGAVYLSTHIGTERPVALKVIVPQFMQRAEFVERFKREARAAGRLRHPNVVDVTDFGFANTSQGRVAYLVMEYLDGCTLGEILDEEKQLPLAWTLDILEQVCSAVHEAHNQGIIHRDLKPDNIWLEPNQRGGYTVKVLDFGIAKLEEPMSGETETPLLKRSSAMPTQAIEQGGTVADHSNAKTIAENRNSTMIGEGGTLIQTINDAKATTILPSAEISEKGTAILPLAEISEKGTAIMSPAEISEEDGTAIFPNNKGTQLIEKDEGGTKLISREVDTNKLPAKSTSELTRVGAVLGTPLYMSPEQCRGEKLTPHSDIYSLAVIAYQMLSGKTPFSGDFTKVMDCHKEVEPPPLEAKKVPKKVKKVLFSALSKNREDRPPTAEAFASELRSHSEGIGELFRKALTIYGGHLPKFLLLSLILAIPLIITNSAKVIIDLLVATEVVGKGFVYSQVFLSFADFFVKIFYSTMLVGTTTWIVAQILAVPLRPLSLKPAFRELKNRWKSLLKTVTFSSLLTLVGFGLCFFPGLYLTTRFMLIAPSIMMEGLSGRAAFRRSSELVKRSFWTVFGTTVIVYLIPIILAGVMNFVIQGTIKGFTRPTIQIQKVEQTQDKKPDEDVNISVGPGGIKVSPTKGETEADREKNRQMEKRIGIGTSIFEIIWMPVILFLSSFTAIITSLLYFKTRLAGGESMQDLLTKFEDAEHLQSKWQHRIRERLIQSGRISSTTDKTGRTSSAERK
jgi:serine/threonine protein kinase